MKIETSPSEAKDDLFEPKKGHIWGGGHILAQKRPFETQKRPLWAFLKKREIF